MPGCCGGGVGWSDAGITVPFALYNAYGDTKVITDHYSMMKKFMDYIETSTGASLIRSGGPYDDWLNLDDPTNGSLLATAYYSYISDMMSTMSAAIGKDTEAVHYADLATRVKAAFVDRYIAADGTVSGNSQAGYAIAIGMDLVPANLLKAVGNKYVAKIASHDYHLSTGFLGTPWLLPALTKTGHQDVAYRMLNTETYPSWGYEVASGATTMWERWDSLKPDGSFGDVSMNSFNHYAYGAVGEWMYQNIGGITPTSAGYKTFSIAPSIGGGLTEGNGTLKSVYGTISSQWKTSDTGMSLEATVPVNTTATVSIPANNHYMVTEGGQALEAAEGVSHIKDKNGVVTFQVGSGHYVFSSDPANSGMDVTLSAGGDVLPGDTIKGTVHVSNLGTSALTGFAAVLKTSPTLTTAPSVVSADSVAAGKSIDLPFTATIPLDFAPGKVSVTASVTALVGSELRQFTVTAPLATVLPAITIDPVTAKADSADQPETATVEATITNVSKVGISGRLVVDVNDDWQVPLPSRLVTVAPGASAKAHVSVAIPLTVTASAQSLKVRFVTESDVTLASASTSFTVGLKTPPEGATDHIDLGEGSSESAHHLTSSNQGGVTQEAGLSRRYSGIKDGSWFAFDMAVTPNQPFIIRGIETYDQAQIKGYDILVNDQVVDVRVYQRTDGGEGLVTFQVLVLDDGTLTSTGTVNIKMRYNGLGTHDPSLADVWTMPVPADTVAPSVVFDVSHSGNDAWYLGGAKVTLQASDARSGVDVVEYKVGDGEWTTYDEPFGLDDGTNLISYRASDIAGNTSAVQTETVRVDSVAPTSWGWLSANNTVAGLAQDGGSGLGNLSYSPDGDAWYDNIGAILALDKTPAQVHLRAVDAAGNVSDETVLEPEADAPVLTLEPGQPAQIESSGFVEGDTVRIELHSDPIHVLGTVVADAAGVVSLGAQIPADLADGAHQLVFIVEPVDNGGTDGSGNVPGTTVTIPAQVIADTGSNVLPWAVGALLLLLTGGGFLIIRRKKSAAQL